MVIEFIHEESLSCGPSLDKMIEACLSAESGFRSFMTMGGADRETRHG